MVPYVLPVFKVKSSRRKHPKQQKRKICRNRIVVWGEVGTECDGNGGTDEAAVVLFSRSSVLRAVTRLSRKRSESLKVHLRRKRMKNMEVSDD